MQCVPARRLDGVEPPPARHRAAIVEALFEAVPGEHVGLQTDNAQAFYETLGFRLQPDFMSRVSGRWLENDANRD